MTGEIKSPTPRFAGVAPFSLQQNIVLHPFPNGGWVVTQEGPISGDRDAKLGAYSSAADMLDALGKAICDAEGGDA